MFVSTMSSSLLVWCCIGTLTGLAFGLDDIVICTFDEGNINPCLDQNTDDVFDWTAHNSYTNTNGTGPDKGFEDGESNNAYYAYIEASEPRVVNDNARLTSDILVRKSYDFTFYYYAKGSHIGVLNVFTKAVGSDYHKLVWYHSGRFNASVDEWTEVQFITWDISNFQVIFEGIRSIGDEGDIALDDIYIYENGDAPAPTEPSAFGLPFICNFGDGDYCSMVTPYYTSQLDWQTNKGPTGSDNTGPSVDHTLGTDQGYYIYISASFKYPSTSTTAGPGWRGIIATHEFFPSCGQFSVDFWYHAYGDSVKRMMVLQEGYDTPLWDVGVTSKDEWINVQLSVNTTHPTKLLFVGEIGDTHTSDYALDDIAVEDCGCEKSCTFPTTTGRAPTTTTPTTTLGLDQTSKLTTPAAALPTTSTPAPTTPRANVPAPAATFAPATTSPSTDPSTARLSPGLANSLSPLTLTATPTLLLAALIAQYL